MKKACLRPKARPALPYLRSLPHNSFLRIDKITRKKRYKNALLYLVTLSMELRGMHSITHGGANCNILRRIFARMRERRGFFVPFCRPARPAAACASPRAQRKPAVPREPPRPSKAVREPPRRQKRRGAFGFFPCRRARMGAAAGEGEGGVRGRGVAAGKGRGGGGVGELGGREKGGWGNEERVGGRRKKGRSVRQFCRTLRIGAHLFKAR